MAAEDAILARIQQLVARGDVRISDHGYDELADDAILAGDALTGLADAVVVEDYPSAGRGPSILTLQMDRDVRPIHVVWGIPKRQDGPAVLVTAYRPDPEKWSADFRKRKS